MRVMGALRRRRFLCEIKPERAGLEMLAADPGAVTAWLDELTGRFAGDAKRRDLEEAHPGRIPDAL